MPTRKRKSQGQRSEKAQTARRRRGRGLVPRVRVGEPLKERRAYAGRGPALSGDDLDADWRRADSSGEEGVDQDVVDQIGRALGVERAADAELHSSEQVLRARDRRRWDLERQAAKEDEAG
jgi:hypothetical protein